MTGIKTKNHKINFFEALRGEISYPKSEKRNTRMDKIFNFCKAERHFFHLSEERR